MEITSIYDANGNILNDVDMSRGDIIQRLTIKKNIVPIDNIKKFAYDDDDYEIVNVYVPKPSKGNEELSLTDLIEAVQELSAIVNDLKQG